MDVRPPQKKDFGYSDDEPAVPRLVRVVGGQRVESSTVDLPTEKGGVLTIGRAPTSGRENWPLPNFVFWV